MLAEFVWNLDPVFLEFEPIKIGNYQLGPLMIRYYGLIFVLTLLGAYWFWIKQMARGGYPKRIAESFFIWGVVAVVVGARLGHCFFYRADYFLANPHEILFFWEGGLASHGATVGLTVLLILFSRVHKLPILDITDRFAMSAAVGAAGVRLGNFLNSEIVGRATDLSWAVHFVQSKDFNDVPRHPSQLYEFAMGITVLLLLILADKLAGKEKRPRAMMTGLFLTLYFAGRFCVEFFKEYHIDDFANKSVLTMGQYLSIIPFAIGIGLLIYSGLRAKKARDLTA
jgi:phosphatidylglycerol---prolipoprotein diacylglyceryl transferase